MDAELVFRLILIAIAVVALVSIIMHYNKCIQNGDGGAAPGSAGFAPGWAVEGYADDAMPEMPPAPPPEARSDEMNPPVIREKASPPSAPVDATEEFVDEIPAPAAGGYGGQLQSNDLLPKLTPEAQKFAQLYPCGQGDLSGINFLESGTLVGQSTNLKRNANLQLRSDPPIPYKNVSPWLMSTIRPDCYQRTFELGDS